jgi:hypothetical protein
VQAQEFVAKIKERTTIKRRKKKKKKKKKLGRDCYKFWTAPDASLTSSMRI